MGFRPNWLTASLAAVRKVGSHHACPGRYHWSADLCWSPPPSPQPCDGPASAHPTRVTVCRPHAPLSPVGMVVDPALHPRGMAVRSRISRPNGPNSQQAAGSGASGPSRPRHQGPKQRGTDQPGLSPWVPRPSLIRAPEERDPVRHKMFPALGIRIPCFCE